MQLTLRQAADYLGVGEATARRWVHERALPVHEAHERLYLNAVELWEWAIEHGVPVSRDLLDHARRSPDDVPPLSTLLTRGGIVYDVDAATKPALLRALVERLPLPPEQDRETLVRVLDAREAIGSTGVGDGIAIPHVRNPIVLHVERPFVMLALLGTPVEFGAIDERPVHALFMVVSPTVPAHLRILAELGFVLRDPTLRDLLRARASTAEIIGRIEFLETTRTTGSYRAVRAEP
ncbi:MAG TPA: PTS sugar transporter subunit IIA [Gemmatimonadaceae bacterium]|nr:PTS sugar transporter subunit IIA [Gemmatimonadaceae bacterium]